MADEPNEGPETQDNPDLATDPTAADAATTAGGDLEPFDERFDPSTLDEALQPAYKSMQGRFTQRMQEIASKESEWEQKAERLDQLEAFADALNDPEQRDEILRALGAELPDPDDDEDTDPVESLQQKIEQLEQKLTGRDEAEQQQEYVRQEHAFIDSEIEKIEKTTNEELSDEEASAVGALAQTMRDQRGVPDVQGAYKLLFDQIIANRRKAWGAKKTTPRPGGGGVPRDKIDITDPEQRQAFLASQVEGIEQGVT